MSSYGNSKRSSFGDKRNYGRFSSTVLHPNFEDYQLIGDSQFLRFSEQILKRERRKSNGLAYIGFCVSGQKIRDLSNRIDDGFYYIQKNVVLMIGTNDLLQGTPSAQMRADIESLVLKLIEHGVQHLILLTLPPVPRLEKSRDHWSRLKEYNDHIRSFHNGEDVFVVDAYPKFIKRSLSKRNSLSYESSPNSRNSTTCSPMFSNADSSPADRLPVRGALRISFNNNGTREVFVTERSSGKPSFDSPRSGFSSPASSLKRGRSSPDSNDSPPAKRRYSRADDDHDDTWYEDESFDTSTADVINMALFEEYFSGSGNRKDMIHLNYKGLRAIQTLIGNQIDEINGDRRRSY